MTAEDTLAKWYAAAGPWASSLKASLLVTEVNLSPEQVLPSHPLGPVLEGLATDDTAFIIDLPGVASVALGLSFAARGACLVPLFNTTPGRDEYVPTSALAHALTSAARQLAPRPHGPPVFLLDVERKRRPLFPFRDGYDNRWYVFDSDFPTAEQLAEAGLRRLVVVTDREVGDDLRDALIGHSRLERLVVNVTVAGAGPIPFPRDGLAVVRGLAVVGRKLSLNSRGTFGTHISTHG